MDTLTQDRLRELLHYDPETGAFTWRSKCSKYSPVKLGERAESPTHQGYWRITLFHKEYRAHRLAWFYVFGAWPRHEIDHRNGDPGDNRIENLRDVDRRTNGQNQRRATRDSFTGFLGVTFEKGRFKAAIGVGGRTKNLGRYDTAEEAHGAYLNAKRSLHAGCTI